jgi:hypothetical protein
MFLAQNPLDVNQKLPVLRAFKSNNYRCRGFVDQSIEMIYVRVCDESKIRVCAEGVVSSN